MRKLIVFGVLIATGAAWLLYGRQHLDVHYVPTGDRGSDTIVTAPAGTQTVGRDTSPTDTEESAPASGGRADVSTGLSGDTGSPGASEKRLYGSPYEASFLTQGKVNDRALKALEAKNFDEVINRLDAQNKGVENPLATTYRKQLEGTLSSFGAKLQLDRLACGSNVCLGSIRSPEGDKSFRDWYENVQTAAPAPMGGLAQFSLKLDGGVVEHRILFTTDPRSAGFIVGPPTNPPAKG